MGLDNHTLSTILINALPAKHEAEARNLAPHRNIGRDEIVKVKRERYH